MVAGHPRLAVAPWAAETAVKPTGAGRQWIHKIQTLAVGLRSVTFTLLQLLHAGAYSRVSHLAPFQPGSHSQRPVTRWQLRPWTQLHLFLHPSPKTPFEQASDKTQASTLSTNILIICG